MEKKIHKILCTLGPASLNPRVIRRLEELGVDLFRINLSHTKLDQIEAFIQLIRTHSRVPICLDTQGAQARTGDLKGGHIKLEANSIVALGEMIPIYPGSVMPQLSVGDIISVDFNAALLQIVAASPVCKARVLNSGLIGSNKAISVDHPLDLPPLTDFDQQVIDIGMKFGIEHFALSFTNRRADVELLRGIVGDRAEIISKVESRMALTNLASILEAADAVLIDRGDLSREVPLEQIPLMQKRIIRAANDAHVPVYVATNLLESMVNEPRPTRAEVNDVINTLLDGADGLVLAAETAIGQHPVECTQMIRTLINQYHNFTTADFPPKPVSDHLVFQAAPPPPGQLPTLEIDFKTLLDIRQIVSRAFAPLTGFMGREDLQSVLENYHLKDGSFWPMPVLFQVTEPNTPPFKKGDVISLTREGKALAHFHIEEDFPFDLDLLALKWFGTTDTTHPGVSALLKGGNRFLAGRVEWIGKDLKVRHPYELTPSQAKAVFEHRQWQKIAGLQVLEASDETEQQSAISAALDTHHFDGIFIHSLVSPRDRGPLVGDQDFPNKNYEERTLVAGFATYPRHAGSRDTLFSAVCHRNFGCSHYLMSKKDPLVKKYRLLSEDIGIEIVPLS